MDWDNAKKEIKNRISLVELISRYVVLKPQTNGDYLGLCPFHSEKTPSFHVHHDGFYKCFGCGKSGDIFTFLMEVEKYSFFEAFKILAKEADVTISTYENEIKVDKEKEQLYDIYKRVAQSLHYILLNKAVAKGVRSYLEDRGISLQTIQDFMLGYMPDDPDWFYSFLQKYNYSAEFLVKSGLFSRKNPKYSLFTGRLLFPIFDTANRVIAFSARELRPTKAKYINSPQTPLFNKSTALFGINLAEKEIRKTSQVYLVEGNFDVLSMHQSGIKNCVAPLGTSFTIQHGNYLKKLATKAYTLFDGDAAGIAAAKKVANLFQELQMSNYVITLPKGLDPSDMLKKYGVEYLQNINKYSISSFTFLLQSAIDTFSLDSIESKEAIIKEVIPFIHGFETQTRKTEAIRELSSRIKVDFISLQNDIINNKFKGIQLPSKNLVSKDPKKVEKTDFLQNREFLVLLASSKNRELFLFVKNELNKSDFENELARELFIIMVDCFLRNCFNPKTITQSFIDENERKQVEALFNKSYFVENKEKEIIHDSIKGIKLKKLLHKKDMLIQELSSLSGSSAIQNEEYGAKLYDKLQDIEDKIINLKTC